MDQFLQSLREDFRLEANELLGVIELSLIELEQGPDDELASQRTEEIYRATHSLKGAARSVNYTLIEQVCMSLEEVWKKIKGGQMKLQAGMYGLFHQALDLLRLLVDDPDRPDGLARTEAMCKAIANIDAQGRPKLMGLLDMEEGNESGAEAESQTGDIAPAVLQQPENTEFAASKTGPPQNAGTAQQRATIPVNAAIEDVQPKKKQARDDAETVRVSLKRLNQLLAIAEELAAGHSSVSFISQTLSELFSNHNCSDSVLPSQDKVLLSRRRDEAIKSAKRLAAMLDQYAHNQRMLADDLVYNLKQTLMFPVSDLTAVLPRMVRDIAEEAGKQVELELAGGEVTLDKRILEGLKDPLIHLVRNAIDHGIEPPAQRLAAGKPAKGKLQVMMHINPEGKAELIVSDDGKGIDTRVLRQKAVEKGLITPEVAGNMPETEALRLIFKSGLSTREVVSRISGHGLGMSIVAEKVSALTGSIELSTEVGKGTRFVITLPRMLALFRGIRVRSAGRQLLIPTASVVKALRVHSRELQFPAGKPCLAFDGKQLPLVSPENVLGISRPPGNEYGDTFNTLIINNGVQLVALLVDDVIGEEQGVVKPFDEGLGASRYFSGVLVLGDASLVPVLKPGALAGHDEASPLKNEVGKTPVRLLVAEDSLTVRNMLRSMLEMAGFSVVTAVNGAEAFQIAQREAFDAVVSDVEMPGMNGFELTRRLRNLPEFENLPIILVTSLDSEDDRRRGMEAGANAYVVKSNFEQGKLIETINRLVV